MRVSVIVPTYNEADNIAEVIDRLRRVLGGQPHEIIIVDDDSPDGTWQLARRHGADDPAVRVIRRIGKRGWPRRSSTGWQPLRATPSP